MLFYLSLQPLGRNRSCRGCLLQGREDLRNTELLFSAYLQ